MVHWLATILPRFDAEIFALTSGRRDTGSAFNLAEVAARASGVDAPGERVQLYDPRFLPIRDAAAFARTSRELRWAIAETLSRVAHVALSARLRAVSGGVGRVGRALTAGSYIAKRSSTKIAPA